MKFRLTSPVGIAITVAGVVLALSPEARKATRRLLVKSTAILLGTVEGVTQTATEVTLTPTELTSDSHALERESDDDGRQIGDTVADTAWSTEDAPSDTHPH